MKRAIIALSLCLSASLASAQYAGLVISEVINNPDAQEMVEVTNTSGAAIDISGVILSDEDVNANEGAIAFPASTILNAGATVVVVTGTSATEPTWLDSVPAGVRIFNEPARNTSAWTAANGNTITVMVDIASGGGTPNNVDLSTNDSIVMFTPAATFNGSGIVDPLQAIDGLNWDIDGPYMPINSTGQTDTKATELSGFHRTPFSFQRAHNNTNTGTWLTYVQDTPNVGSFPVSSAAQIRNAGWYERPLGDGAVCKTLRFDNLFNSRQLIHVVEIDDTAPNTDMQFRYGTSPTRKTVPAFAAEVPTATAVINGNFFDIGGTGETVQYLKVNGTVVKNLDVGAAGAVIDSSGNTTTIPRPGTGWPAVYGLPATAPSVMATNVMSVIDRKTANYTTNTGDSDYAYYNIDRHPRTAIGTTPDGKVMMVVVDGRQTIAAGMTLTELARTMIALGCSEAVNMDGGGSSTMWDTDLPGNGVSNLPSEGSLRAVANALMITTPAYTGTVPALDARRSASSFHASVHAPVNLTVNSGSVTNVTLSFVNYGTTTWTPSTISLGTSEQFDRASSLYTAGDWVSTSRPTALDQASVAPGATGTFTFQITAPTVVAPQFIEESFALVDNLGNFFGPWQNRLYITVNAPPAAGEIVLESRDVAGNLTAAPTYVESGSFGNTTSKSTVTSPGVFAPGARYNNAIGSTGTFRPTITQSGNYNVYVTLGAGSNNNAAASFVIKNAGADVTGTVNLTSTDTATLLNKWHLLAAEVPFTAGGTAELVLTNVDGNSSIGKRFVMDAVRFSGPVSTVNDWTLY
ncbi:phosphodiester glycosidase family protein [Candidatus Sumerlaeota bacterium]|nr:phosphodiester glycosidase family protein [Candidatus Sumerlaeota bacterium]